MEIPQYPALGKCDIQLSLDDDDLKVVLSTLKEWEDFPGILTPELYAHLSDMVIRGILTHEEYHLLRMVLNAEERPDTDAIEERLKMDFMAAVS